MATFKTIKRVSDQATVTATNQIVIGPVDIRNFESFSVLFQNNNTSINFLTMAVQTAPGDQVSTQANIPPDWVALSTAILEVPSTLGATSSFRSSRVPNAYGFLRIIGTTSVTATAGILTIKIEGKQTF